MTFSNNTLEQTEDENSVNPEQNTNFPTLVKENLTIIKSSKNDVQNYLEIIRSEIAVINMLTNLIKVINIMKENSVKYNVADKYVQDPKYELGAFNCMESNLHYFERKLSNSIAELSHIITQYKQKVHDEDSYKSLLNRFENFISKSNKDNDPVRSKVLHRCKLATEDIEKIRIWLFYKLDINITKIYGDINKLVYPLIQSIAAYKDFIGISENLDYSYCDLSINRIIGNNIATMFNDEDPNFNSQVPKNKNNDIDSKYVVPINSVKVRLEKPSKFDISSLTYVYPGFSLYTVFGTSMCNTRQVPFGACINNMLYLGNNFRSYDELQFGTNTDIHLNIKLFIISIWHFMFILLDLYSVHIIFDPREYPEIKANKMSINEFKTKYKIPNNSKSNGNKYEFPISNNIVIANDVPYPIFKSISTLLSSFMTCAQEEYIEKFTKVQVSSAIIEMIKDSQYTKYLEPLKEYSQDTKYGKILSKNLGNINIASLIDSLSNGNLNQLTNILGNVDIPGIVEAFKK